jgi:hypothetical protein
MPKGSVHIEGEPTRAALGLCRALELALFMDAKLDVSKVPAE